MLISVINRSTMVSNADVETMCRAIQIQLSLHFLPAYNLKSGTIKFYSDENKAPGYSWKIYVVDDDSVPGALGYHQEETNGKVDGYIMCRPVLENGGTVMQFDPNNPSQYTVSGTLSHEVLECINNRFTTCFFDNGNVSVCGEVCDPCESLSYPISVDGKQIAVSDFVFPSYFNQFATLALNAPFNFLGTIKSAFEILPGGYQIQRTNGPGSETQVFGRDVPEWRKETKRKAFSRGGRIVKK